MYGGRITDAVAYFERRGEVRGALRTIRDRRPERFRWRKAVDRMTATAGGLRGQERMRVEEPVRELVLDVSDRDLVREVILDARRNRVDLDRGEILPARTVGDLRRYAFLTETDLRTVQRHVKLDPADFFAPVDTAAIVLVGRAYANAHRKRMQELWLSIPDPDGPDASLPHFRALAKHAEAESRRASRWTAFAKAVLGT